MKSFALFRLPHAENCTLIEQHEGEPLHFQSCRELNGQHGFVLAPFHVSAEHPILMIRPDQVQEITLHDLCAQFGGSSFETSQPKAASTSDNTPDRDYAIDFANFHAQLSNGVFRKIVLSRSKELSRDYAVDVRQLFCQACRLYPRLFIALVSLPDGTCWLTATPEILLEGIGSQWRTIALAGTMQLQGDELQGEGEHVRWSAKNIQEQRYVATYISQCLEQFSLDFVEEGPRTVRAANLVHLRSDFTFHLPDASQVGNLLQALHPTPAVCGLPKHETFEFILHNEHTPRQYYSGFMGPLDLSHVAGISAASSTHLYVSLRCMQITDSTYRLYAGGGLLKDSLLEQEWQETEAKMQTMRGLLHP